MQLLRQSIMWLAAASAARAFTIGSGGHRRSGLVAVGAGQQLLRMTATTTSGETTDASTTDAGDALVHGRMPREGLSMETKTLVSNIDMVLTHLKARRASEETLTSAEKVVALQAQRVKLIQERDTQLNIRKEASGKVGKIMQQSRQEDAPDMTEELEAAKAESNQATELADKADAQLVELEAEQNALLAAIPNLLDDRVPDGTDDTENDVVSEWGNPEDLPKELGWTDDFEPKWHDDVALGVGGYLAEQAVKISGSRFVALSGDVARLERAIGMFFVDQHCDRGYTEVSVPLVVGRSALEGTSQLPKFQEDLFAITPESHTCNGEDAFLIPTAEVPVTNLHRDSVLEEKDLPIKYVAWTPCFRAEAGSYGRDTKGLIRTHQFGKVELVKVTSAEMSDDEHEALTSDAEACLQALKLPYRKVRLCSGDIGFSARHCYDLEVWLPGAGEFREISSCSNTGDFQARRMGLRYRPNPPTDDGGDNGGKKKKQKKTKPVLCHTINGSGLATGRTLVAVLENYQKPDGSIAVPEVLQPYMGGKEVIMP